MKLVDVNGAKFSTALSKTAQADAMVLIFAARQKIKAHLHNWQQVQKTASYDLIKAASEAFFSDPGIQLACAVEANSKLTGGKRKSLEECLDIPDKLTVTEPLAEAVSIYPKLKHRGGVRPIHNADLGYRTLETIALKLQERIYAPRPWQFTFKGVVRAIETAQEAINASHIFAEKLDVQNYFGSFTNKVAETLPFTEDVVKHVILARERPVVVSENLTARQKAIVETVSHDHLIKAALSGVPQGARHSSMLGAIKLAELGNVNMDCIIINYADDFWVLAQTALALKKAAKEMSSRVAALPGGNFCLLPKSAGHLETPQVFLGHRFCLHHGKLSISVDPAHEDRFFKQLRQFELRLSKTEYNQVEKVIYELVCYVRSWCEAFKKCENVHEYEKFFISTMEMDFKYHLPKIKEFWKSAQLVPESRILYDALW